MKSLQPKKKQFDVSDFESLNDCLNQMQEQGYRPVRRMEKPIFKEGEKGLEVARQSIIFEGKLIKSER
ncbi:NETI motif-containing protein [Pullulanibacillus camelliae]|uniref:NETI motif-containing protein n=1 Tax=Pullulanibacillus camelliae TaxID=1707096 RepID=A0A8J2YC52_9BACL|nr:NETI motif-containing protein [Pullulanibacillus camelliae]GGE35704.1 NETI motif-containing protein [Pullulanibacillus camelliae]